MSLITSKVRLWIEYALIAVVLATVGLAVTLKMQTYRQETSISNLKADVESEKVRVERVTERLELVEGVNDAQAKVIETLGGQREKDNLAVTKLLNTYQTLRDNDQRLRDKLDDLEKTDADAKNYFDIPMPESVACLYDDSCTDPPAKGSGRVQDPKDNSTIGPAASMLLAPEPKAEGTGLGKVGS